MDNLFEQIDEELDADRVRKQWEKNRPWIIGATILFFLGLFAYVGWDGHRKQQDAAASDLYIAAMKHYEKEAWGETEKLLQPLFKQFGDHGYGLLGQMVEARTLAETGRKKEAADKMENLADRSQDGSLRDLALFNAALVTVDDDGARAQSLLRRIRDESPFRPHALEILGLLAQKQKDMPAAAVDFQKAIELGAKGELRTRLDRRLERLGKTAKE
ncbi:MAG: Tetratricopeptide TPR 2 repeat protein [Magnetococcales bacterium]|nr:Tetratricopeptide TPR 2 repeat protein [Magnetococcales bacterium]HIJ84348.1 tetratricopeptide repeat protein [Magnetococcales bacterium]